MFKVVKAEGILGTVSYHCLLCLREGPHVPVLPRFPPLHPGALNFEEVLLAVPACTGMPVLGEPLTEV